MSILNNTSPTPLSPSPAFVAELRKWLDEQRQSLHDALPSYKVGGLTREHIKGRHDMAVYVLQKLDELEGAQ